MLLGGAEVLPPTLYDFCDKSKELSYVPVVTLNNLLGSYISYYFLCLVLVHLPSVLFKKGYLFYHAGQCLLQPPPDIARVSKNKVNNSPLLRVITETVVQFITI